MIDRKKYVFPLKSSFNVESHKDNFASENHIRDDSQKMT